MANNSASLRGSPVRREREEEPVPTRDEDGCIIYSTYTNDKPCSSMDPAALQAQQDHSARQGCSTNTGSNIFIEAMRKDAERKSKKTKKKKVEVSPVDSSSDTDDIITSFTRSHAPLPNAKSTAEQDFRKETEEINEQQQQYNLHISNLRTQYLDDSSEFLRNETPRITRLVAEEDYGGLIEDSGQISEIQDRARKYAETLSIKFRSARGIQHQRNDCELSQKATERMLQRLGKQMLQLLATTGDLLMMATEKQDAMARITYMTQVSPQWNVFYDMLMDRAEQWVFYSFVTRMLDTSIKLFKEQATKQRIKHEMDALDIAESDLESSESSSSSEESSGEDEEGEESDDDDSDESDESGEDDEDEDGAQQPNVLTQQ
jgi:hypothetical protein